LQFISITTPLLLSELKVNVLQCLEQNEGQNRPSGANGLNRLLECHVSCIKWWIFIFMWANVLIVAKISSPAKIGSRAKLQVVYTRPRNDQ
jgi:hypothetical protein